MGMALEYSIAHSIHPTKYIPFISPFIPPYRNNLPMHSHKQAQKGDLIISRLIWWPTTFPVPSTKTLVPLFFDHLSLALDRDIAFDFQ